MERATWYTEAAANSHVSESPWKGVLSPIRRTGAAGLPDSWTVASGGALHWSCPAQLLPQSRPPDL